VGASQPRSRSGALARTAAETLATARLLRRLHADAVMVVLPHPDMAPGAVLGAALAGPRAVASVHLADPGLSFTGLRRRLYTFARNRGVRWVAVSQDNLGRLAVALRWPQAALTLVRNGTPEQHLPPPARRRMIAADVRRELGLGPGARLLLTVARLNAQKGHAQIIDSMAAVSAARADVWWVWAGDGPLREELIQRLQAAAPAERVRLLGRRDDVTRLMLACDLLVAPSVYEGLPLAVLEAHMAVLPVIASDAGSLGEAVRDGREGLLVPVGDGAALADATLWALDHGAEMTRMATAGRARALAEFSSTTMCDRTLALLGGGAQPPSAA
jgi:glycosyltransferase involved in cell wall biosynthesis